MRVIGRLRRADGRAAILLFLLLALPAGAQNYCNNPVPPCDPNSPSSACYKPPDPPPKCEPKECDKCTKSPCYVGSGVYAFDALDLQITTSGFPIEVKRLYQSSHAIDGESGFGWVSSLSARLYYAVFLKAAPNTYQKEADVRLPNGTLYRFVENADGSFAAPEGRFDTLVHNGDGSWDFWLQRTRFRYHFGATGNLEQMVDDFGNTLALTYVNDRLTRIADASGSGRYIDVSYGADGRISDVTDLTGRNVHYSYNSAGVMTSVTNPAGHTTTYSYVNGKYVPLLNGVTDHWGRNVTTVVYDAQDRVRSYTDAGETYTYTYNYNGVATTTAKSDSSGNTWQYPFGSGGLVADSKPPGGGAFVHDGYYANGLIQLHTDALGVKTHFTYDARGNPLTITRDYQGATAVQWRYTYDANFPDQALTVIPYDPATNQVHQHWQGEKFEYYAPGSTAPGALYRVYKLNNDGATARLMATFTYDSHGRVLSETDALGNVTNYTYDANGNLSTIDRPSNNDVGTRLVTTYTSDALGRQLSVTGPDGKTQSHTWDVLDRPKTLTLPKPSPSSTLDFTLTYFHDEYDAATQLLFERMVDANGRAMKTGYDQFGRIVRRVDEAGNVVRNVYTNGLLTSQIDANNYAITYAYDARRRVSTVTHPDGTFELYTYNADGGIASRRDRANQTVTFGYDRHKRLVTTTYPNGGTITKTFTGQKLTQVVDTFASPSETHTFTWDATFRLSSLVQAGRGTVNLTWRADDRRATLSVAGGATETYGYYPNGSLRTIDWSVVSGSFKYDYTSTGQTAQITFPNGQTRGYTYDDQGRPTVVANVHPTAGTLASFGYTYDADAFTGQFNRLGVRTGVTATVPALGLASALTKIGYDDRYAVVRADYPAGAPYNAASASWAYDAAGNRVSATVNGSTATYSYQTHGNNPLNGPRLLSDGANSYTYDANGNVTARSGSRGNYTFSVDYENRLRSVNGDVTAGYLYDYEGRRTLKTVSGAQTSFIYDGVHAIAATGAEAAAYLFGPGMDEPLAIWRGGQVYYTGTDVLGSVVTLNDAGGTVQSSYAWDVWGQSVAGGGAIPSSLGFTAREGSEAGLQYYRARHYDPAIGRFLSEDPIANFGFMAQGEFAGPQLFAAGYAPEERAQRYAYVRNAPLSFTDPFGLEACCNRDWSDCWGECIKLYRWTWTPRWIPLFTAVPKPLVPPGRVVNPGQRLTTLMSSAVHMAGAGATTGGRIIRGAGRIASRVATPITLVEGFWDWGVIIYCAEKCRRDPCNPGR